MFEFISIANFFLQTTFFAEIFLYIVGIVELEKSLSEIHTIFFVIQRPEQSASPGTRSLLNGKGPVRKVMTNTLLF